MLWPERRAQFVEQLRELTLQIRRQDCVSDRPAYDRAMLSPEADGLGPVVFFLEFEEAIPNPIALLYPIRVVGISPAGSSRLERLPILIARELITDLGGICHPCKI